MRSTVFRGAFFMNLINLIQDMKNLDTKYKSNLSEIDITGVTSDSRAVESGFLFAALKGVNVDGHDYIENAIQSGAKAILVSDVFFASANDELKNKVTLIPSINTRSDFAKIVSNFYQTQPDNIMAVTGTNGKSSIVSFISQLLCLRGQKTASLGTIGLDVFSLDNNKVTKKSLDQTGLTTADTVKLHQILKALKDQDIDNLAMEASSHGLDQHRLDGVELNVAGFSNLTQDHLDYHKTMDAYFEAKAKLFLERLKDGGTAVINADDEWGKKLIETLSNRNINIKTYGTNGDDLTIISMTPKGQGLELELRIKNGATTQITLPLIGAFQAYNALCAFLMAGLGFEDLNLLENLSGVEGRMDYVAKTPKGMDVYVDYAHTPNALETVLKAARPHTKNKLYVLYGCGGNRDASKRPLMGQACEENSDIVILTDDNPRDEDPAIIRSQAKVGSPKAIDIGDRRAAILYGLEQGQEGDVFIIAGKGHENGQEIKGVKHDFHDASVVLEQINNLKHQQKQ